MLNSTEILERGIVTKVDNPKCKQQVGIDLEVISIDRVEGMGVIGIDRTTLPAYVEVKSAYQKILSKDGWRLGPGVYQVTFKQGCKIAEDTTLLLRQRSSLLRSGTQLHSSVFDPGFETENMGSFITVSLPIFIEKGARICQAYVHQNTPADKYDGQFQNDNQRG